MSAPATRRKQTALLTTEAVRFRAIERRLRGGSASFAELRGSLRVSPATLKRDLQRMRIELGAPIHYDRMLDGYRLVAPWTGVAAALVEQLEAA